MSDSGIRVLGISGSLRQHSFNRGLLRAAQEVAPGGVEVDVFDLSDLPLYNQDVDAAGTPEPVADLQTAVRDADALLIATPEYNTSMSGVLKNAIDWASQPFPNHALSDKPLALMGASPGRFGTARAQGDARSVLTALGCYVLPKPVLQVGAAGEKFSAEGDLEDETVRQQVRDLLEALVAWTRMLRTG
ncbi:MAG: NAD(P)H-dependent oxidoreductase [Chloroflexi bacterium]|nr:NAD(P)H-dependent oxidoreductase [Chloroflexota bacterium]